MSDEFNGRIVNPHGVEIDLPYPVFKLLKKLHLLERDGETGKRRIQARVFGLMALWDGPDCNPYRDFQHRSRISESVSGRQRLYATLHGM